MDEIVSLWQEGVSINEISRLLEMDRKTVRKYLKDPRVRRYARRKQKPSPIEPYVDYVKERLAQGVWNAVVLTRELKVRGYSGSYTTVKSYLQPLRTQAQQVAVRRFETPPGRQAQVDWGVLGTIHSEQQPEQKERTLYAFVMTLGYSRAMFAEIVTDTSLGTFLELHEEAFTYLGGVTEELLYDNDGMVVVPSGWKNGEPTIQPDLVAFGEHHGYRIRLCRPHRAQTKGKIERGIGYIRQSFLCGCQANNLEDLRSQLRVWLKTVANSRVHGTTREVVQDAWQRERPELHRFIPMPVRLLPRRSVRQVPPDAYVTYRTNRYSVPWELVGTEVFVIVRQELLEIWRDESLVARHEVCHDRYQRILVKSHHEKMPYGPATRKTKARIHISATAPEVEKRPLSAYEEVAA